MSVKRIGVRLEGKESGLGHLIVVRPTGDIKTLKDLMQTAKKKFGSGADKCDSLALLPKRTILPLDEVAFDILEDQQILLLFNSKNYEKSQPTELENIIQPLRFNRLAYISFSDHDLQLLYNSPAEILGELLGWTTQVAQELQAAALLEVENRARTKSLGIKEKIDF